MSQPPLGIIGIMRLGLVQASLGAMVVLTTSTLNRVMVIELALPATLPGALVALHYGAQALRPRWGYGSDMGGRRTVWIVGGMLVLALGGVGSALSVALMSVHLFGGIVLAVISFTLIGIGVGACGTSLLVVLAKQVESKRRAAAATIVWIMMIAGFVVTTAVAGRMLDPYSPARQLAVTLGVAAVAIAVTLLAIWNVENREQATKQVIIGSSPSFSRALVEVWAEPQARLFTKFVFLSMLAYSSEELILDPFAGSVFGYTPGESTQLSSVLHGGVLAGMILVAVITSIIGGRRLGSLRGWSVGGCIASALALLGLMFAGIIGPPWPLRQCVLVLGLANGTFSIAAIGSMMSLAGEGRQAREGVRLGLWGAAQGVAFGFGGLAGSAASDLAHDLLPSQGVAYASVFCGEALLFLIAAMVAFQIDEVYHQRGGAADENLMASANGSLTTGAQRG